MITQEQVLPKKDVFKFYMLLIAISLAHHKLEAGGGGKGGSSAPPPVEPVAPEPIPDTRKTEVESESTKNAELESLRKRRGMAGTILTSANGTLGTVASQGSGALGIANV